MTGLTDVIKARLLERLLPPGFAVVPIVPTGAMKRAAGKAMSPGKRPTGKWVSSSRKHEIRYTAMVKAYMERAERLLPHTRIEKGGVNESDQGTDR